MVWVVGGKTFRAGPVAAQLWPTAWTRGSDGAWHGRISLEKSSRYRGPEVQGGGGVIYITPPPPEAYTILQTLRHETCFPTYVCM